jgi:transcriptional regulator with XRE-family HTH domain
VSTENITIRFGKRLRKLRKEKGWTKVQMADAFGIDRSYISDMENGKKNVCLPTMEAIAMGFAVTVDVHLFARGIWYAQLGQEIVKSNLLRSIFPRLRIGSFWPSLGPACDCPHAAVVAAPSPPPACSHHS